MAPILCGRVTGACKNTDNYYFRQMIATITVLELGERSYGYSGNSSRYNHVTLLEYNPLIQGYQKKGRKT